MKAGHRVGRRGLDLFELFLDLLYRLATQFMPQDLFLLRLFFDLLQWLRQRVVLRVRLPFLGFLQFRGFQRRFGNLLGRLR